MRMKWKAIFDDDCNKPMFNECLIDKYRIQYDVCSQGSLEDAKEFYNTCGDNCWVYIGSGHKTWHNGKETNWEKLHYFFIKPERLQNEGIIKILRKLKIETINKTK